MKRDAGTPGVLAATVTFFRRALGHYLAHLGATDAAAMFTAGADVAG